MFKVMYRSIGSGLWKMWMLPVTQQAADGHQKTLDKTNTVAEVQVVRSGAPTGGMDLRA